MPGMLVRSPPRSIEADLAWRVLALRPPAPLPVKVAVVATQARPLLIGDVRPLRLAPLARVSKVSEIKVAARAGAPHPASGNSAARDSKTNRRELPHAHQGGRPAFSFTRIFSPPDKESCKSKSCPHLSTTDGERRLKPSPLQPYSPQSRLFIANNFVNSSKRVWYHGPASFDISLALLSAANYVPGGFGWLLHLESMGESSCGRASLQVWRL